MATTTRRGILAVVSFLLLVALGAGLSLVVGDALGIRSEPSAQMAPADAQALAAASALVPDEVTSAPEVRQIKTASHLEAHGGDIGPAANLAAAPLDGDRANRDLTMAWIARVLLLFAIAWVVIGMFSARTRLVGRPGASAARATWIASFRPWRARESTLGMLRLDRWLPVVVPAALLVATRGVQTSFLAPVQMVSSLGAWLLFVAVILLFLRRRSPWPVIITVAGVTVLRCILTLIALAFTGPGGYGFLSEDPLLRTSYISLALAGFVWTFVAAGWALVTQIGPRRAIGAVLAAIGVCLAVPAAMVALIGLEQALTVWNDPVGLLPWALARILGITTYLEIHAQTAWWVAGGGALLGVIGVVLAQVGRSRRGDPPIRG